MMVIANFSKAEGLQENGSHQPPTPEIVLVSPFPPD